MNNKTTITKENLIGIMIDKSKDDFISIEDLSNIIDKVADRNGNVSKKKLIKSIKSSHTRSVIKNVYYSLESAIFDLLSSADKKQDIHIKLFEGISVEGKYMPEKTKKNNLTGEIGFVESKIKPKFNITRSYCEKLNS